MFLNGAATLKKMTPAETEGALISETLGPRPTFTARCTCCNSQIHDAVESGKFWRVEGYGFSCPHKPACASLESKRQYVVMGLAVRTGSAVIRPVMTQCSLLLLLD